MKLRLRLSHAGWKGFGGSKQESLWLNSSLLSDCFPRDGRKPTQLWTDTHSPIQSIERCLPLGHKSQLLLRHTAIGPSWGPFREQASMCVCEVGKKRVRGRARRMCTGSFHKMKQCTKDGKRQSRQTSFCHSELHERVTYHSVLWLYVASGWHYSQDVNNTSVRVH